MKRKDFLKSIGLTGVGTVLATSDLLARNQQTISEPDGGACTLIPSETEGPFPLDLTANTAYFRKAVNENMTGAPFTVRIRVIGTNNCLPMKNVRVNIWHCNKDGLYSGYDNNMNAGQAGKTYCRGYQFTDSNGVAEFTTIFPGWYSGRICHIHFKVSVSSAYAAVSQLTFPIKEKNALFAANSALYTKGDDPTALDSDNVFSSPSGAAATLQVATLTKNAAGGYESFLEVNVTGNGTVGVGHLEAETAKQFLMGQNFPNPFENQTTIPFQLINPSMVKIKLFDLNGRNVATILDSELGVGEHQAIVNFANLGLPKANYAYELEVKNSDGLFRDVKLMTAAE